MAASVHRLELGISLADWTHQSLYQRYHVNTMKYAHLYLSLPQHENYAAVKEHGANPHFSMQLLRDKFTDSPIISGTKTNPRSVNLSS